MQASFLKEKPVTPSGQLDLTELYNVSEGIPKDKDALSSL
jgi:hypothetical protein